MLNIVNTNGQMLQDYLTTDIINMNSQEIMVT